ncbi:MAG TPA: ABC transporter permease [Actinomycetota bacterium]
MLAFAARRMLVAIPILLVSSILVFAFMRATTNPTQALVNPRMSAAEVDRVRHAMGLDRSGPAQYVSWLKSFAQGDWGLSLTYQAPVAPIIRDRLFNTVKLMSLAVVLSFLLAVGIGVVSAVRAHTPVDYTMTGFSFLGLSAPTFWMALMIQLVLGFYLMRWLGRTEPVFPTFGMHAPGDPTFRLGDFLRHATLPSLALMVQIVAGWSRYERSSMVEVLGTDYLRTSRAKGLRERRVVLVHALRNALIPLVTVMAVDVGGLFSGLIVTEVVFSWPGMGSLFTDALRSGDYPIVLPWLMVTAIFVIGFNLMADMLYGVLDPRVRHA